MVSPLVSIGLPVYNGENYLAESIDSILRQTYTHWQLLLTDNGSTDRTREICRRYADQDRRIFYFPSERNRGASWNFNRAFWMADGALFRWASHDDVCEPELIERCVEIMQARPQVVLCYSRSQLIDENGIWQRNYEMGFNTHSNKPHERFLDLISRDYLCNQIYGLCRKEVLARTRMFTNLIATDIHLLAELSLYGPFHEIPDYLFQRRDHPLRSVRANPHPRDLLAWFSPDAKDSFRFTKAKRALEYARVISRSPLDSAEKLLCLQALSEWMLHRFGMVRRVRAAESSVVLKAGAEVSSG